RRRALSEQAVQPRVPEDAGTAGAVLAGCRVVTELLFRDDAYLRSCEATLVAADERGLRFDRTVFYPTGGGQPGDVGVAKFADGTIVAIVDTVKGETPDEVVHVIAPDAPRPAVGARAVLELDWERRHRLMRMHTCLHLLSAVLPYPVT